jgi:hypothetical protein
MDTLEIRRSSNKTDMERKSLFEFDCYLAMEFLWKEWIAIDRLDCEQNT